MKIADRAAQGVAEVLVIPRDCNDNSLNAEELSLTSPGCSSLSTEAAYGVIIALAISIMMNVGLLLYSYKKRKGKQKASNLVSCPKYFACHRRATIQTTLLY